MKKQKGITLIALIITIIVMLILVGVSVSVALNGGLFKTAKVAAEKTKAAVQEESSLKKYEYEIAKAKGEYNGSYELYCDEKELQEKYGLKIGDKVNYDESDGTPLAYETDASKGTGVSYNSSTKTLEQGTYTLTGDGEGETKAGDLEWRVLGINDEGQVELISTTPTECILYLYGKAGYLNVVTENGVRGTLDTFCNNIYGQGTGAASARSLTAEDINKLGNYNPVTDYSGYGTKYKYKYDSSTSTVKEILSSKYEEYKDDMSNSNWKNTGKATFYTPNWTIDSTNVGPEELENKYYSYTVANQVKITDPVDMATLITNGASGKDNVRQWLASCGIANLGYTLNAGVFSCSSSVGLVIMYTTGGKDAGRDYAIRPVVTLESDIKFTKVSDNNFNISL